MRLVRPLDRQPGEPEINVYECRVCKVSFTTEDHLPIGGEPPS